MTFRSELLAAVEAQLTFAYFAKHLKPSPDLTSPDFTPCWQWTGTISKASSKTVKKRAGEDWRFVTRNYPDRPYHFLNPFGKIDPRRVIYELFDPSKGLTTYNLKPICNNALCCNPRHQEAQEFTMKTDDAVKRYATYLKPNHIFFSHKIGTFNPNQVQFAKETPKTEEEAPRPLPIMPPKPASPPPPPISLPNNITDAFGNIYTPNSFSETENPDSPYESNKHWQTVTNSYPPVKGIIPQWLNRWGNLVPNSDYSTINKHSEACVEEAFSELEKPTTLTKLLALDKFRYHPKLVLNWYSKLADEEKSKIDMRS